MTQSVEGGSPAGRHASLLFRREAAATAALASRQSDGVQWGRRWRSGHAGVVTLEILPHSCLMDDGAEQHLRLEGGARHLVLHLCACALPSYAIDRAIGPFLGLPPVGDAEWLARLVEREAVCARSLLEVVEQDGLNALGIVRCLLAINQARKALGGHHPGPTAHAVVMRCLASSVLILTIGSGAKGIERIDIERQL